MIAFSWGVAVSFVISVALVVSALRMKGLTDDRTLRSFKKFDAWRNQHRRLERKSRALKFEDHDEFVDALPLDHRKVATMV